MVYINSRGEVVEHRPFLANLVGFIYGFIEGVQMFFRSLFGQSARPQSRSSGGPSLDRGRRPAPKRRIAGLGSDGGPGAPPCAPGG